MSETTYYQRNRDVILNRAKDYYKNDKERLRDNARDKYRNLYEEKKIERENVEEIDFVICPSKKKQKLKEYQKIKGKLKSLNLVINIFYGFNNVCYALVMHY